MTKHYVWGRLYSDQELQEIAREMNQIGRNIERKTKGVSKWAKEVEKAKEQNGGLAF